MMATFKSVLDEIKPYGEIQRKILLLTAQRRFEGTSSTLKGKEVI